MSATVDVELITTKEASRIARVNQASIRRWIHEGKLTRYGTSGKLLVDAAELRAHIGLKDE